MHVRHMVGGVADIVDEKLYRFDFPEKPGALLNFLTVLGDSFNICMFHYRNHGATYGRALVGIQVPLQYRDKLESQLAKIQYRYWNESTNPAYYQFLRSHE